MKVIVADDEQLQLIRLEQSVKQALPNAEVLAFPDPFKIMKWIDEGNGRDVDVAFLDIEMGAISGMQVAKHLQAINPKINLVFVTGYTSYAPEAFSLRASGYVAKPATLEKVKVELENLRNVEQISTGKPLTVKCFGTFTIFSNGEPLKFKREKTKELFAYLIDRNGAICTPKSISDALWEEDKPDYLRQLTKDLKETLKQVGAEGAFIKQFKGYAIDKKYIDCDYFDYLDNNPSAIRLFKGEYMSQYSWAEATLARLANLD